MSSSSQSEQQQKKKERVVVTPPCPSPVSTAYVVLRGAVLNTLGVDMNHPDIVISLLQPTYIKEERNCGKFSISLGKKQGCGEIGLVENQQQQEFLLTTIESAANRIIQEGHDIHLYKTSKQTAVDTYGPGVLDMSLVKKKDSDILNLAMINDFVVCASPGVPFHKTSCISKLLIEMDSDDPKKGSFVTANKNKAEITLKFSVPDDSESTTDAAAQATINNDDSSLPDASLFASLLQTAVRTPEGRAYLQQQAEEADEIMTKKLQQTTLQQDDDKKQQEQDDEEMVVNAFEVKGKIDYTKLVDKFGSKLIDESLLRRFEKHCTKNTSSLLLHRFLRRNIFFSHRDLDLICDCLDQGVPMYLYTGRGPSSASMHLGHLIPFLFTQWLQEALNVPLVIQMTDDEKFLFKGTYTDEEGDNLDHFAELTMENARDILACGFDPNKTFVFSDLDYVGRMYPNIVRIWKAVTTNTVNGIFGFDGTSNTGKVAFPAIQAAPSFASSFPVVLGAGRDSNMACLIPCAIDQDPYFRMTRDVARKLVTKDHKLGGKPALIHSKFFPPLQGATGKMSSSDSNSAIFLTDTAEEIKTKINSFAFSGGQETKALQQELGADLEVDVAYQWLRFFLEDDEELERIGKEYGSGQGEYWSTGKVKERLIGVLQELVAEHQERRAKVTDEEVRKWMSERCIL